jgi:hypothetical protein
LDLTQSPNPLQLQRPQSQFQIPLLPQIFGQALQNQSKFSGLQMSQDMDPAQLSHQLQALPTNQGGQQNSISDTVSAATAAIAADPNFTAALAAAITSIIGGSGAHTNNICGNNANPTTTSSSNGNITSTTSNSNSSFQGK